MSPAIDWSAPAKLNLMLHIVGRRADGYHELQTVFQLIDLCTRKSLIACPSSTNCSCEVKISFGPTEVIPRQVGYCARL